MRSEYPQGSEDVVNEEGPKQKKKKKKKKKYRSCKCNKYFFRVQTELSSIKWFMRMMVQILGQDPMKYIGRDLKDPPEDPVDGK